MPEQSHDRPQPPGDKGAFYPRHSDRSRTHDARLAQSAVAGENERGSTALPDGSLVRFMGDYGVSVPLWGERGLLFSKPEDLVRELGVSPMLAADLETWAIGWDERQGKPDHDAEAAALVRRLMRETEYRLQVLYQP